MEPSRFRVTLVHGTWGKESDWPKPESTLSKELKAALTLHGDVEFTKPLRWSGRNNHKDRRRASRRLYARVQKGLNPCQVPVVIAHSHGGNIALKAIATSPDLARRTLIVAIATPFLHFTSQPSDLAIMPVVLTMSGVKLRSHLDPWFQLLRKITREFREGTAGFRLLYLAAAAGCVGSAFVGYRFLVGPRDRAIVTLASLICGSAFGPKACVQIAYWYFVWFALVVAVVGGIGLLCESYGKARKEARPVIDRTRAEAIAKYGYFQEPLTLESTRLLVTSSTLDEALGVLKGAWWVHRTGLWSARVISAASILTALGLTAALAYVTVRCLFSAGLGLDSTGVALIISGFSGILCIAVVAKIMSVVSWLTAFASRIMGLGLHDSDLALLTSVKASRRPPGIRSTPLHYGLLRLRTEASGALFHSLLYSYPAAIRDIADWIVRESTPAGRNGRGLTAVNVGS